MEFIKEMFAWITGNYVGVFITLTLIWPVFEVITRFTPTKKDDSLLERLGQVGRKLMDALKIPNVRKDEKVTVHEKTDELPKGKMN